MRAAQSRWAAKKSACPARRSRRRIMASRAGMTCPPRSGSSTWRLPALSGRSSSAATTTASHPHRVGRMGQRKYRDFADCELAWTNLPKAVRRIRYMWNGMFRANDEPRGEHPTQKPLQVMEWAIKQLPEGVETIVDPFMGCTTGVAAVGLGLGPSGSSASASISIPPAGARAPTISYPHERTAHRENAVRWPAAGDLGAGMRGTVHRSR